MCVTMPNVVPIGQTVPAIWLFFDFVSKWRLSAIVYLLSTDFTHEEYLMVFVTV